MVAKQASTSKNSSSPPSSSPASSAPVETPTYNSYSEFERKLNVTKSITKKKPKMPPCAFFFYMEDFRKEFHEQNPDVKSRAREFSKACGEKWKRMTYEEKVKYYDIAIQKMAEFEIAMKDYTENKESGEYEDSDEDSDSDDYY
ncbi:unnamed protein product [Linum tenue]|uniref:HMG box domain-containing protein n=1 Tax=Linum tenue TaxID=586396 RepID=A0AAV0N113_9ROSI|nr:unnamed protein product [Linum tenue]